jgi:hypothetical protein
MGSCLSIYEAMISKTWGAAQEAAEGYWMHLQCTGRQKYNIYNQIHAAQLPP